VNEYRPFIEDPRHVARLAGERYVVLRPTGAVVRSYEHVRSAMQERLAGLPVSFTAQPHVTLTGFPTGTPLAGVQRLVTEWARSVPPLRIEVERVRVFPAPDQVVVVQVRKTPELFDALSDLRRRAPEHGLPDWPPIAPADWIFHLSVAYCSALAAPAWAEVARDVESVRAPAADCTLGEVEIAVFDGGRESSGGVIALSAAPRA